MTEEELRLRRLAGQYLLSPADGVTVAGDLCGLQAQYMGNVLHALRLRTGEERTEGLVKSWTLRGTLHVFPERDLPLMLHRGRKPFLRPCDTLESDGRAGASRKAYFAALVLEAVGEGAREREELKRRCFAAGMTEGEAESLFDPWGGLIRALCEAGRLCHEPEMKKTYRLCPAFEPLEGEEARRILAERYFLRFSPATVSDAAYFFGTSRSVMKALLDSLPLREAVCGGRTVFFPEEAPEVPVSELPPCLFLAGFDQLMLGYRKEENPFLPPEYLRGIFSRAGQVYPAVLLRGRVCGRWKRTGRRVQVTLFSDLPEDSRRLIGESARAFWPEIADVVFAVSRPAG